MDFDKALTIVTFAGLFGLVILNFQGSTAVVNAIGGQTASYVKAVQGR